MNSSDVTNLKGGAGTNRQHTPGPWHAEIIEPGKGALIWAFDSIAGMRNSGDYLPDEFEANARLIAAAPDLLEALMVAQHILNTVTVDSLYDAGKEKVRAAIAKATGAA